MSERQAIGSNWTRFAGKGHIARRCMQKGTLATVRGWEEMAPGISIEERNIFCRLSYMIISGRIE